MEQNTRRKGGENQDQEGPRKLQYCDLNTVRILRVWESTEGKNVLVWFRREKKIRLGGSFVEAAYLEICEAEDEGYPISGRRMIKSTSTTARIVCCGLRYWWKFTIFRSAQKTLTLKIGHVTCYLCSCLRRLEKSLKTPCSLPLNRSPV